MAKRSFWGRYDIRAVVNEDFGPAHYRRVGQAFARYLGQGLEKPENGFVVAVGFDARIHSPALSEALMAGLTEAGVHVVSLGLSTSPVVYFSEHLHALNPDFPEVAGTITVTASHNPAEYNGMKFTFQKRTMTEAEFQALQAIYLQLEAQNAPFTPEAGATAGTVRPYAVLPEYTAWLEAQFGTLGRGIKVVIDSGNATAGICAPEVFRRLGCEVIDLFTEPDGRFPNHHPDPCVHKNLVDLIAAVQESGADFGVAFDGDADRLGVVDNQGRIVPGDQLTLFLAEDVLKAQPGATIVFDIKSSETVFRYIESRGGQALFAPSGHVFMKRLMKEQNLPLGGELSGHLFFRDRHWGFDDALYAACRLLQSVAARREAEPAFRFSDFVDALPGTLISEEIRVPCTRDEGQRFIANLQQRLQTEPDYFGAHVTGTSEIDGLRINIGPQGFFLIRPSNTEPCVTLRFEAPDAAGYALMKSKIEALCSRISAG